MINRIVLFCQNATYFGTDSVCSSFVLKILTKSKCSYAVQCFKVDNELSELRQILIPDHYPLRNGGKNGNMR